MRRRRPGMAQCASRNNSASIIFAAFYVAPGYRKYDAKISRPLCS